MLRRGQLSTLTSGITTSASLFGAMLGSLAAFLLKDRVGRRTELFFSATAYGAVHCPCTSPRRCQSLCSLPPVQDVFDIFISMP